MSDQPPRPGANDPVAWQAYWKVRGMPWRRDPEIDEDRKVELAQLRESSSDSPFRYTSLSRADVEWLLETHEFMLDLAWADLVGASLQGAHLDNANLQEAHLDNANLQEAELREANLQEAHLDNANLQGASLWKANLQGAELWGTNL